MATAPTKKIEKFFISCFKVPPERITVLQQSGSGRLNARIHAYGQTFIATVGDNIAENEVFIYLSRHFTAQQLPVPRVLHVSPDRQMYIQEDAGLEDLFSRIAALDGEEDEQAICDHMRRALKMLINLQLEGDKGLNYNKCFPGPGYTPAEVLADLNYFYASFCIPAGLSADELQIAHEFKLLSRQIDHCARRAFMHRDFQSRNIMINNDQWTIIDFQGGRKGPGLYDAVSLLYQSRLMVRNETRNLLLQSYCEMHSSITGVQMEEYLKDIPFIRLIRLLQVMGAYGKRGLIEKKSHFIKSIGPGIDNIEIYLQEFPEFIREYPELADTLQSITANKKELLCSIEA